jgi:hypothetical protein
MQFCVPYTFHAPLSLILLHFMIWIIFAKDHKLWSISLCSFVAHLCCCVLGPNIFLSTLLLNDHQPLFSTSCDRQGFTPIHNRPNCSSVCFELLCL